MEFYRKTNKTHTATANAANNAEPTNKRHCGSVQHDILILGFIPNYSTQQIGFDIYSNIPKNRLNL